MRKCQNCSKQLYRYAKGNLCITCFNKSPDKWTEEARQSVRESKLAGKNPMWRGDRIGYSALHTWVGNRLPKPRLCECCKRVPPIDLANKGVYDRNLENWEWLCRRCHMTKDGRIIELKRVQKIYRQSLKGGAKNEKM